MTASLPILKLGYRNPGHLLFTYCAYLSRGELWVRSPDPFPKGTELKLEFAIPGHRWTERLAANVSATRSQASRHGPPGMHLKLSACEDRLADLVDRLVPLSSPCRVQLVGANAFSTRHVASITQTVMDCRIEHRELREDVLPRCAGADLIVIDLDVDEDVAISLISELGDQPNAPTMVVLCSDLSSDAAQKAAQTAHVARLPLEASEFRRALLRSLSQTCWLGQHRVANIVDKVQAVPESPAQPLPKTPIRLRAASPSASIPLISERKSSATWSADTSWSSAAPELSTSAQDIYDTPAVTLSAPAPAEEQSQAPELASPEPAELAPPEQPLQPGPPDPMQALGTDLELSAQWDEWLPPPPKHSTTPSNLAQEDLHRADSLQEAPPAEPSLETSAEDLGLDPVTEAQPSSAPTGCDDATIRRSA